MNPTSNTSPQGEGNLFQNPISRRSVLFAGLAVAAGGLLSACGGDDSSGDSAGSDDSSSAASSASSGTGKKGGNLRIGVGTGSVSDTVDAHTTFTLADAARLTSLYDPWSYLTPNMDGYEKRLAVEYTANATGDVWTVKLRPDVTFHDGKPFTADDAIFSIQRIFDPNTNAPSSAVLAPVIDPTKVTKVDDLTVQFELLAPHYNLEALLSGSNIVPVGYDPKTPVGTGPFKFNTFTPGQSSVFDAYDDYWDGRPIVDQLTIVDLGDDAARLNALVGGQIDGLASLAFSQAAAIESNGDFQLVEGPSAAWYPIRMDCRTEPFSDKRVRQAFRLLVNREDMLQQVYGGRGVIGNDLYDPFGEVFNSELPQREQDIEAALKLLEEAGVKDQEFEFTAANLGPGTIEYATVFAQQATAAGVNVKVNVVDTSVYVGPDFLNWKLANSQWPAIVYLTQVGYADGPEAAYAETGFGDVDQEFADLYRKALVTVDAAERKKICLAMQEIQWDRGGYIVWGFPNTLDAASKKTTGWTTHANGQPFGSFDFKKVSFV